MTQDGVKMISQSVMLTANRAYLFFPGIPLLSEQLTDLLLRAVQETHLGNQVAGSREKTGVQISHYLIETFVPRDNF
jgi:Mg-chelatase subunit ChlI